MDKGTPGLTETSSRSDDADTIEREIEDIRHNLDDLVRELDHRRHELNPMVVARHHPAVFVAAGLALVGAVAGGAALFRLRRRKVNSWSARGKRLSQALARLIRDPEGTTAKSPSVSKRALAATASAVAAVLARRVAQRLWRPNA